MADKRFRNIGDLRTRLIKKLSKQKKKEEGFDWQQLNPLNSEWLGGDREMNIPKTYQNIKDAWGSGDDKPMYDTEGEFEGKEVAEMNAVLADPESSPPISKTGSLLRAEGESPLDQAGREYMTRKRGQEASMADFGDEEGGGAWNETLGLLDPDSIGTPTDPYMSSENLKGENRYLNKLARERFAEQQDMSKRLDLPGISEKISGQSSPELSADQLKMMGPEYESNALSAAYLADEDESELDRIGRENMINAMDDLGPDKMEQPGESIDQTSIFDGLFSSDDDGTGKKKKKMSKEAMKVGADLLQGYLQEPAQGKRQMATSSVTRGSVPFAGLLAQKSKRQKAPYYTPRGLV
jgi:hypothetical protein